MTTGCARARLAHGLKLDALELSCPVLVGASGSIALPYQTPSPILRDWNCTKYSRQRRHVQGRFAAKNAPAGQRQIRTISVRRVRAGHWDDSLAAPSSASGSGKRRLGEVQVSAACCADLFWTDRGSLPLLTPWPWHRPVRVVAVPISPCPATRGRHARWRSRVHSGFQSCGRKFPSARRGNTRPLLPAIGAWHRYAGSNTSNAERPACLRANSPHSEGRQSASCKGFLQACP